MARKKRYVHIIIHITSHAKRFSEKSFEDKKILKENNSTKNIFSEK